MVVRLATGVLGDFVVHVIRSAREYARPPASEEWRLFDVLGEAVGEELADDLEESGDG